MFGLCRRRRFPTIVGNNKNHKLKVWARQPRQAKWENLMPSVAILTALV